MADSNSVPDEVWVLLEEGLYRTAASRVDGMADDLKLGRHEWRAYVTSQVRLLSGDEMADRLMDAFGSVDREAAMSDRLELRDRQRTWDERKKWRDD